MLLHGDSKQNFAVAIMSPNKQFLTDIATKIGVTGSIEENANKV